MGLPGDLRAVVGNNMKGEEMKMFKKRAVMGICAMVVCLMAVSGVVIADNAPKININTATVQELTQLEGIGDAYARRIVEHRENHGAFKSVDELVNVKGVGEKTLEKNRHKITVAAPEKKNQ